VGGRETARRFVGADSDRPLTKSPDGSSSTRASELRV